jgi:hypothetical protein
MTRIAGSNFGRGKDLGLLCMQSVVWVAASATSWSLIQKNPSVCVCVCVCVCLCVCVCVCVWEREREKERETEFVLLIVCEWGTSKTRLPKPELKCRDKGKKMRRISGPYNNLQSVHRTTIGMKYHHSNAWSSQETQPVYHFHYNFSHRSNLHNFRRRKCSIITNINRHNEIKDTSRILIRSLFLLIQTTGQYHEWNQGSLEWKNWQFIKRKKRGL